MPLWLAPAPLVLASKSAARRGILAAAGIPVEVIASGIDERAIERGAATDDAREIARLLADAKASAVSQRKPGRLVIGADQTLQLSRQAMPKPATRDQARDQLRALRGKIHALHSVVVAKRDDVLMFEHCDVARLEMRNFSDQFLEDYLDVAGPAATESVGGYQWEKLGIHLFEQVAGDYFTILGLPLLPLLGLLRRERLLAE
jgi:septum formation protein